MSEHEENKEENLVDEVKEKERIKKLLQNGLQQVAKTADNSGYSFVTLKCQEKEIGKSLYNLVEQYKHLRYIDLSKNGIENIEGIQQLDFLVYLNLRSNNVKNLQCFQQRNKLNFLQFLDLQENQISELEDIKCVNLKKLNLNINNIDRCVLFTGHPNLEVLEIRRNKLQDLTGLSNCPNLLELYLPENQINSLQPLVGMNKLKVLFLRDNKLINFQTLNYQELCELQRLNVRQNQIDKFHQLKYLKNFSKLQDINISGNPCTEEGADLNKEVLMILNKLKRLNKEEVKPEDVEEAQRELRERISAEEEKRKAEEEEQRQKEQDNQQKELSEEG